MNIAHKIQDILQLAKRVFIVAEIGKNFIQTESERPIKEYIENAKELIYKAKAAGADAVKFQTHNVEDEQFEAAFVSPHFSQAKRYSWVERNTRATPLEFWRDIKAYADALDLALFTTPMSRGAAQRVSSLGFPLWKVGSGDVLDFVLLDYLASTGKPIIISTGMSTMSEIDRAVEFLCGRGADFAILHCVSKYPASVRELSLGTISSLSERYHKPIGFSDHSIGMQAAVAAVANGAKIIEKHFSLSRELWGADHKVSLTPEEFAEMVRAVRNFQADSGGTAAKPPAKKRLVKGEEIFRPLFRKTLVASRPLLSGAKLSPEMIYAMRPQAHLSGLPSEAYESVIGKTLLKDLNKYEPITWEVIK